jgi:excisionase family DNA binding protein
MESAFWTKKELEEYLHVSHGTIDKIMKTKQVAFIKVGKKVLFRKTDIDAWLETKRVK